ncbi:FadR/GntR family transcriptional regulator [uncultured Pseudokineococcus sp.]|uniref:FadR/GntR family transcriptional regulator n=1 Tax=uncultured Pseudokineococcus sp. TaxID=1642928 RepID=UPI0026120415|nr:FCD domain-containing protein [uncultured Pseudokineococcus sp.]
MRAHELVLAHLEGELVAGRVALGGRLPAERALAEQLGVSRSSVREAVRVLEAMGVVRTAAGSGPEAGAVVVGEPAAPLGAALRLHAATSRLPIADVVATRVLLETWAVAEAARRARAGAGPDLADADRLLGAMDAAAEEAPDDAARYHLLDAEFHVALAAAAGNAVVEAVMASLREAIHGYVMAAVPALPSWPTTVARLRLEHRSVLDLVRAGSPDEAAAAVRAHIEGFSAEAGLG